MNTVLRFVFSAIGLLVAARFVPGIHANNFLHLLLVAVILGALNMTLGIFLKIVAFIPMILSLGCFSIFINGLVFWAAGTLSSYLGLDFRVDGFWPGFFGALVSSFIAWLLGTLFIRKERPRDDGPRDVKVIN